MGGASRAAVNDPTATYWNPAGLSHLNATQITVLGQILFTYSDYTPNDTLISINALFREGPIESGDRIFGIGNLFAVYVPRQCDRWRFGFGAYVPTGVGSSWDIFYSDNVADVSVINGKEISPWFPDSEYVLSITEPLPEKDFRARIGTYTFSPAISFNVNDNISIGGSVLFSYSELSVDLPSSDQDRTEADTGVIFQEIDMTGYGIGGILGIQTSIGERLILGFTGKYEFPYQYTGKYSETTYKFYNQYLSDLGGVFGMNLLSGGVIQKPVVEAVAELDRPYELGLGVSYSPISDLILALDLSYVNWSVIDTISVETDSNNAILESLPMRWEDTYRISLGCEYQISRYEIRAGLFYEPNPAITQYQNLFIPDMNDRLAFTAGVGSTWRNLTVEFSGEFEYFGEIEALDNWKEDRLLNTPGLYNGHVYDFMLSLTYRF